MARHTSDCGAMYPRGCRLDCNCWCHDRIRELQEKREVKAYERNIRLGMNPKYLGQVKSKKDEIAIPNINEYTEQLLFKVIQVKDIDKALGIGNRIYKLDKLKKDLQSFLGIKDNENRK